MIQPGPNRRRRRWCKPPGAPSSTWDHRRGGDRASARGPDRGADRPALDHGKGEELRRRGRRRLHLGDDRCLARPTTRHARDRTIVRRTRAACTSGRARHARWHQTRRDRCTDPLTDPDQAVRFANETGVDALAIAIGTRTAPTSSGHAAPRPDCLKEIAGRIAQPIVLRRVVDAAGRDRLRRALRRQAAARAGDPASSSSRRSSSASPGQHDSTRLAALGRLRQVLTERPDIFNLYELMGEVEVAIRTETAARSACWAATTASVTPPGHAAADERSPSSRRPRQDRSAPDAPLARASQSPPSSATPPFWMARPSRPRAPRQISSRASAADAEQKCAQRVRRRSARPPPQRSRDSVGAERGGDLLASPTPRRSRRGSTRR